MKKVAVVNSRLNKDTFVTASTMEDFKKKFFVPIQITRLESVEVYLYRLLISGLAL
jgi:hypothetical protein